MKSRAFTLIEIIIVVGIIIIMTAIVVAGFRTYQPNIELSGSIRKLVTDLRHAQQLTITEQILYCLLLIPDQMKYQIIKCDSSQIISEVLLSSDIISINSSFPDNKVQFNPYGSVKEEGTISLENTQGQIKTVEIKPSGFIKMVN